MSLLALIVLIVASIVQELCWLPTLEELERKPLAERPPAPKGSGGPAVNSANWMRTQNTKSAVIRGMAVYINDEFVGIATGWEAAND